MAEYWFKQRRRGVGAGVPMHWKGWVAFGVYAGAIIAMPWVYVTYLGIPDELLFRLIGVIVLSVPFGFVVWKKTEGGWRWRSDEEESVAEDSNRRPPE
jgi:hypothetical protein